MAAQEIDLDDILLTPAAVAAWGEVCRKVARILREINTTEIPDERARINDDGTLTIFVSLPNGIEIEMAVPADQWTWLQ